MATARRNKSFYKAKPMKSTNAFSVFDQAQIQEFKEAFNLIDQDKDGKITETDLRTLFKSLGKNEHESVVTDMLKECTGPMNFTMFISKFAEKIGSADPDEVLLNAFSMFDLNDTGLINCDILKEMLSTHGERYTKEESVPLSDDGLNFDYKEFAHILRHGEKEN